MDLRQEQRKINDEVRTYTQNSKYVRIKIYKYMHTGLRTNMRAYKFTKIDIFLDISYACKL